MTPREFLTELWGDPPPAPVYIYMLPTRQSIWFSHFENLDAAVAIHAEKDVYTSGGLGPLDNPHRASNRRVQQKDVAGIAGLWADIDVAHQVHGKKDLPQTIEQALGILELAEFQPTMLVNSGHGIQAWWLFTSPWLFNNTQEYWEARRLSSWWHDRIQALYRNEGCRIDSVQNLDRVMRIPGTWNNKIRADVRPVRLMKNTGERFNLDEFLDTMPPDYQPRVMIHGTTPDGEPIGGDNLRLDPTAEVPTMKFGELIAEDTRFFRSWQEDRPDWPDDADRSPSGYDMSLANIAARAGWTDQEICNLLIAKRREHGQPMKLRENYYAKTIARARAPVVLARAEQSLKEAMEMEPEDGAERIMDNLSIMLGINIRRIVEFTGDPPIYWMSTDQGDITIGKIDCLTSQTKFMNLVATITHVMMNPCKPAQWRDRVQAILQAAVIEDVGDASHPATETRAWLTAYLSEHTPQEEISMAIIARVPFMHHHHAHIFMERFTRWVDLSFNQTVSAFSMGQRMKLIGGRQETINTEMNGSRTTRSTWRLPPEFDNWTERLEEVMGKENEEEGDRLDQDDPNGEPQAEE